MLSWRFIVFVLSLALQHGVPALAVDQDACDPAIPYVTISIVSTVLYKPVHIETYVSSNTIINVEGGITINVNNAPTSLSTNALVTITTASTGTM